MLKRLIEVALPLKEVSEQSAREKSNGENLRLVDFAVRLDLSTKERTDGD